MKRLFLLLFAAISLTACSDSTAIELEQFSNDFLDWYYSTYPITATWIGIHDYDSRMNEVSLESIAKNRAALEKFQLRLSDFNPDKFSIKNKIDYIDQKIHKRGMTEEEAVSLMMNEGFQEESEAKAKWVRAQLSSTQLSSYYVGATAIFDLREKYMEKMGDDFDLKSFHESLLSHGSPPVMYLTELLLSDGDR